MDLFKSYGSLALALGTVLVAIISQWAVFGSRLGMVEAQQVRTDAAITLLQEQHEKLAADIAAIKAKIDAINDNVLYIRGKM